MIIIIIEEQITVCVRRHRPPTGSPEHMHHAMRTKIRNWFLDGTCRSLGLCYVDLNYETGGHSQRFYSSTTLKKRPHTPRYTNDHKYQHTRESRPTSCMIYFVTSHCPSASSTSPIILSMPKNPKGPAVSPWRTCGISYVNSWGHRGGAQICFTSRSCFTTLSYMFWAARGHRPPAGGICLSRATIAASIKLTNIKF